MPTAGHLKPNHKTVLAFYEALKSYAGQHVEHEGALETAFSRLLADTARPHGWTLIPKMSLKVGSKNIAPDGTLRDEFYLRHGYWEAKDTHDDLDAEIRAKIRKGYPLSNTIFEDTRWAVLYQNGQERNRFRLTKPQALVDLLNDFFAHVEPDYDRFDQAVDELKERVPELAQGWTKISRRPTRTIRGSRPPSANSSSCASRRSTRTSAGTPWTNCSSSTCSPNGCSAPSSTTPISLVTA